MSPIPTRITSTLRLLCNPSEWEWLKRFFNKAGFLPIQDYSDSTKPSSPEYWKDPETGMPRAHRFNDNKTSAFARFFFPEEAKRIDEIHKRDVAARRARAAAAALESDVKADAHGEETGATGAAEAGEAATNEQKLAVECATGDNGNNEEAGDKGAKTSG